MKDVELMRRWHEVTQAEYNRLVKDSQRGRATLLDQYGATDPSEFFAVATECFFEKPREMLRRHPLLYGVLRDLTESAVKGGPERAADIGMPAPVDVTEACIGLEVTKW